MISVDGLYERDGGKAPGISLHTGIRHYGLL